jgi:short-subunit dehydrogenase
MHSCACAIKTRQCSGMAAPNKSKTRKQIVSFMERYGPWAIIAGASEGTGRAFARQIAAEGVNCILIARREAPLEELAATLRAESKVECITASIDLASPDAFTRIAEVAGDREIGLYISNAGGDASGSFFLDQDVEAWVNLVNRNIVTSLRCCHHFGQAMRARGRGGIILVGSVASYGSGPNLAAYSGVKAFDLCFSEGLWAELEPHGVDVLNLVMTTTDTPALRKLLARKGVAAPPNLDAPEDVAKAGLDRLPHGPVHNFGLADDEAGNIPSSAAQRRDRVRAIAQASKSFFGAKKEA